MAVVVNGSREHSRITELENLHKQLRWWRWGTTSFMTVFLVGCLLVLNSSVRGLTSPGPKQEEFVQTFNQSLQKDTVPTLEHEASATVTEIQPEIKDSILKLRKDVPQIAQSAEDQIRLLQTDLPVKGEAILNKRFGAIISSRKDKIKELYPNVTEDQVSALVTTLSDHARAQITGVNGDLFGPHQAKLRSILVSMDKIRSDQAVEVKNEQPDWEMGVLLLDVFRDDLKGLAGPAAGSKTAKPTGTPNKVAEIVTRKVGA